MKYIISFIILAMTISIASAVFWEFSSDKNKIYQLKIIKNKNNIEEPIQAINIDNELQFEKVALGKKLFHDAKLSKKNTISCSSCHNIKKMGIDQKIHPIDSKINVPTVMNSRFNVTYFWDGRANSLEEQIEDTISDPKKMDSNWTEIILKLNKSQKYTQLFANVYKNGISSENIKNAIATYERSLITPSRFDRFLLGKNTITEKEKKGYLLFKNLGCIHCHHGINVGGSMLQKFGIFGNYLNNRKKVKKSDMGRFNVTNLEADKFVFKVPSLRNVALTAPYLHDGSVASLSDVVGIMIKYQVGREVKKQEIKLLVAFLKTLTGQHETKK